MHSDIKNILESVKTRLDEAKDQISKLEDKVTENIQSEQQKKKESKKWG